MAGWLLGALRENPSPRLSQALKAPRSLAHDSFLTSLHTLASIIPLLGGARQSPPFSRADWARPTEAWLTGVRG